MINKEKIVKILINYIGNEGLDFDFCEEIHKSYNDTANEIIDEIKELGKLNKDIVEVKRVVIELFEHFVSDYMSEIETVFDCGEISKYEYSYLKGNLEYDFLEHLESL